MTVPVKCADGYEGVLCHSCSFVGNNKYMRNGYDDCGKCPDSLGNALWVIGIMIVFIIWVAVLIFFNFRKKRESDDSILFRILMNYFHVITSTLTFSLSYPDWVLEAFEPLNTVG